jgi:hypothetical protein
MSMFGAWVATLAFFFVVFLIGKYLQIKERQDRLTRRASEAIRNDMVQSAMAGAGAAGSWESSTFGTRYGRLTQYERQSKF